MQNTHRQDSAAEFAHSSVTPSLGRDVPFADVPSGEAEAPDSVRLAALLMLATEQMQALRRKVRTHANQSVSGGMM